LDDVRKATAGAEVVVNALNLPYDKWDKGRAEALNGKVLEALKGSGKTMLFPGNVYNYAASQLLITPDTPQNPEKDKGRIRKRMEQMLMRAATEDNLQIIIIRSADFYGPGAKESNFDLAMMARQKAKVLQYPGRLEIGHSWAYLPDLGRAYVKVAEARGNLPQFENFQFEGHFATGHQMVAAIQTALPEKFRVTMVPWGLLRLIGLFVPVVREVVKMNYLWSAPHRLEDKKFRALLGPDFNTPFEDAVAKTTRSYLPATDAAPMQQKLIA
jgi:nucleoside-diphosphate-sugar epimerase